MNFNTKTQTQNKKIDSLIGNKHTLKPSNKPVSKLNTFSTNTNIPLNLLSDQPKNDTQINITNVDPVLKSHVNHKHPPKFKPKIISSVNIENKKDNSFNQTTIDNCLEKNIQSNNDKDDNDDNSISTVNSNLSKRLNQTNSINDDMIHDSESLDELMNTIPLETDNPTNVTKKIKTTDIKIKTIKPKLVLNYKPVLTDNNIYIDVLPDGGRGNSTNLYRCLCNIGHEYCRKTLKTHFESLYHKAYLKGLNASQKTRNLMYNPTEDVQELRKENEELKLNLKTSNMINTRLNNNMDVIALRTKHDMMYKDEMITEKDEIIVSLTKKIHKLEKEINLLKQINNNAMYEELSSNSSSTSSEIGDIN